MILEHGLEYNLNNIKLIETTDDFMNLDEANRNCHAESYDNCTTKSFVDSVIEECGCLPLNMRTGDFEKVKVN